MDDPIIKIVLPLGIVALAINGLGKESDEINKRRAIRKRGPRREKPSSFYTPAHSMQPASDLKDQLTYSSVGSKNMSFTKTFIGPRGTRQWQYFLPEQNTFINSNRPLGFNHSQ
jgi:hypothetical protein